MCGIAGYVGTNLPETARTAVARMLRSLERRGPDAEGLERWPCAIFGHRRLSIFDLSDAGRQPMLSDDGSVGVLFNGAIYNFLDLRRELEALGHRFRSRCDTEVIVRGYQEWGIDALVSKLHGMFAIAVWDERRRTLTLVRDRLGVKPLIYTARNGCLAFASTVRALRQAGLAGDIDPTAISEFLEFGWVTDDRTIFEGVSKLAAGTILEWRNGAFTQRRYWNLPEVNEQSPIRFEEAVEETERLLVEAVRLRLEADVPVGALLSGGIDSSLICWAMARLNANIKTFTVGTPGDVSDETAAAVETARILGIPHEVVALSSSKPPSLDELITAYGEPFACSSALGMLRVSRAVKPKATVLLTGDGGDDVYLGYPFHNHFHASQNLARRLPRFAPAVWRTFRPIADHLPFLRRPKHFLDYATRGLGAVTRVFDGLPYYHRMGLLGDRIVNATIAQRQIPLSFDSARRLLSDILRYEYRMRFVAEFMTKVDGATMHYSIEARSPLLDHKLWEFAATLPFSVRLRNGTLKAVLREIARRRIGPQVALRKKQGFTIPVGNWLAGLWKGRLEEEFATGSLLERDGWLRPGAIGKAIRVASGSGSAPNQLWYLLVLESWMKAEAGQNPATTTPIVASPVAG
jgi:asparagine synthase (glutamine-hydrolysing)